MKRNQWNWGWFAAVVLGGSLVVTGCQHSASTRSSASGTNTAAKVVVTQKPKALPPLQVSKNKHYLVRSDGTPFFYLADTAWELFHRCNREEAIRYLDNRARIGFTVIQAVALAELNGIDDPNSYGDLPLLNRKPTLPAITVGSDPNNAHAYDYWDHVDFIVNEANARGIYIAMLPTWGSWAQEKSIFTPASAQTFGEFLGRRYGDKGIIWVMGGDRNPGPAQEEIWRAMAKGVTIGATGSERYQDVLMTFHPAGGANSSRWFHNDVWLDFNMWQNGHCRDTDVHTRIGSDFVRTPTKPVMDGEPLYEDHPVCFKPQEMGFSNDADIRKFAYWDLFSGAHGHTYGHHSVWQMSTPDRKPINFPQMPWHEAINRPGAQQMGYVRQLMESRPFLTRIPDQSMVLSENPKGSNFVAATRDEKGTYAFVYIPTGRKVTIDPTSLQSDFLEAKWYNPRTGQSHMIGTLEKMKAMTFTPPSSGPGQDWVLILDQASMRYPFPGQRVLRIIGREQVD